MKLCTTNDAVQHIYLLCDSLVVTLRSVFHKVVAVAFSNSDTTA
jgi:hypothetical protein